MDLAKAALDAAVAADKQAEVDHELRTARHRMEQHQVLEQEAAKWGVGPIPIDELRCWHDNPTPHAYYWWAHEINEHFVLIVRVVSGVVVTESRVLTKIELDRTQQHGHEGSSPDTGMLVHSLADIGRRIRNHPSYKEN